MSREAVYVQKCMGVNGLEKIILREVRGFSAEVSFSFSIKNPIFIFHFIIILFSPICNCNHPIYNIPSTCIFTIHNWIDCMHIYILFLATYDPWTYHIIYSLFQFGMTWSHITLCFSLYALCFSAGVSIWGSSYILEEWTRWRIALCQ